VKDDNMEIEAMNRKRNSKILMGAVCGVMLMAVNMTGWTKTAFICEGRIGNAATHPESAWFGDFEFDISTNTAAPYAKLQFGWSNNVPAKIRIEYDAAEHEVRFIVNDTNSIAMPVAPSAFSDPGGLGFLNFRNRVVKSDSSVELTNIKIHIEGDVDASGGEIWMDLDPMGPTVGDNQDLRTEHDLLLQPGFVLIADMIFRWNPLNPPARSQSAVQIGANEYPKVASVRLKEVNPDTNPVQDVDPVAADSSTGNLKLDNPESHGGGLMFFAEKNTSDGNVHNKLKAVAKLTEPVPPGTTITVYFKIFDMDDPTQNYITTGTPRVNIVDTNDVNGDPFAGGDNSRFREESGHAELPTLSAASVTLNPNEDTASVTFEIPEIDCRPGNNWKVVAHTSLDYLNDVEIDDSATSKGLGFRLKSNHTILVPAEFQTELVSIWRTINVEFDTMGAPKANEAFGIIAGIRKSRTATELEVELAVPINIPWMENSLSGAVLNQNGAGAGITLALGLFEVKRNKPDTLIIRSDQYTEDGHDNNGIGGIDDALEAIKMTPAAGPSGSNLDFSFNTDDPLWQTHLLPPLPATIITTMDHYYNKAYIRSLSVPVYLNANPVVTFARNTSARQGIVDVKGSRAYWAVCVVWCYESSEVKENQPSSTCPAGGVAGAPNVKHYWGDDDPEDEGLLPGHWSGTWGETPNSAPEESSIYVEAYRDRPFDGGGAAPNIKPIGMVVAHEVGHQFGLKHVPYPGQFVEDLDGIMGWNWNKNLYQCVSTWQAARILHAMPDEFSRSDIIHMRRNATD
jgi:hypothetical protein